MLASLLKGYFLTKFYRFGLALEMFSLTFLLTPGESLGMELLLIYGPLTGWVFLFLIFWVLLIIMQLLGALG